MNLTKTAGNSGQTTNRFNTQLLRVMRLTAIIVLAGCLQVAAKVNSQTITYSARNAELQTLFQVIEKQTGFTVVVDKKFLAQTSRVTMEAVNMPLEEFLTEVFRGQPLRFAIEAKTIFLNRKKTEPSISNKRIGEQPPVNGTVRDAGGAALPGATILVKGTKKSAISDQQGDFTVEAKTGDILIISFTGYQTKQIIVQSEQVDVSLTLSDAQLDEIQIKGYYNTTKRFNTGNVTTVKSEDIVKQPVSDPMLTLQGRVPGMMVTQTTGVGGGEVKVQIRGRGSIYSGTQPLYVVDGVPYEPNIVAIPGETFGAMGSVLSALNFLNPADIETIDVLKDADATSIYGSRGANGVILVTTKRGKMGKTTVSAGVSYGLQKLLNKRELLNTPQYLEVRREAFKNDVEEPFLENAPDLVFWDTTSYTDWQKELVGKTANYIDAQASISGGTQNFQYLMGGNYHRETTIFPGDFASQRTGFHMHLAGSALDQKLKISFTGNYSIGSTDVPAVDFSNYIYLPPNAPEPYTADGKLNWANSTWVNPFSQLVSQVVEARTNNLVSNIDLVYRIIPGLLAKVNIGYNEISSNSFRGKFLAGLDPALLAFESAEAWYGTSKIRSWISEPQLSFSRSIGAGIMDLIAGAAISSRRIENQSVLTGGIKDDALIRNPYAASVFNVTGSGTDYKYAAVFGRVGYNLQDKYLLNATFRRDGSSRFGPNNKFATFASVGGAWIFSVENWTAAHLPFLSYGKLRGSYGITGNDQIGDYQFYDQYEFQQGSYQDVRGTRAIGLYNPDYEWEKTRKAEIGLELRFAQDRIGLEVSHYRVKSDNQLSVYLLPVITGANAVLGNLPAVVTNRGWEALLTTQNVKSRHFNWSTAFNIAANKNKLESYDGPDIFLKAGRSLAEISVYKSLGVDPQSGIYQFADFEGKPIRVGTAEPSYTTVNTDPAYFGGIQNSFSFKSLRLDIFLQYVKQKGLKGIYHPNAQAGRMQNQPIQVLARWQQEGDNKPVQKVNQNYSLNTDYQTFIALSDASYGDASFIRCKNISLAWQLPGKAKNKIKATNAEVFINAQNVFTITDYEGWDPETQSPVTLPPLFTTTIGLRVTL